MTERLHAVLSPSAADRWLNCAGSVFAIAGYEDKPGSHYASEGTAAHKLLELCLRLHCTPDELEGVKVHEEYLVDDNMIEAVAHAYDYITAYLAQHPDTHVGVEENVHWGDYSPCGLDLPKDVASGTADAILTRWDSKTDEHVLVVMDYKHGAGKVVEVNDNSQLKLYGLGALRKYVLDKCKKVVFVIVQPRARHDHGPVREWTCTVKELEQWGRKVVLPATKKALKPGAPRVAGDHCRWCPAAPTCRALINHVMDTAQTQFGDIAPQPVDPTTLNDDELAHAMHATDIMEAWIAAVRGRVHDHLMAGRPVGAYKLVLGRTTRKWSDDDLRTIVATAHGIFTDPKLYAPRVLLSVAEMEKLFRREFKREGKKTFDDTMAQFVRRSTPPIHVAPGSDPRPPYTPGSEFGDLVGDEEQDD